MATDGTKRPKREIKSTVTVHDRKQIETVFDYYLRRGAKAQAGEAPETLHYRVEAFLFYPRQFALGPDTYPKESFFSDVRPLLRFREPKLGFKAMLGLKPGVSSPLVFLKGDLAARARGEMTEPVHVAVDEARLFACALIGALLRGVDRLRRRLARLRAAGPAGQGERARIIGRMAKLLDKNVTLLGELRGLLQAAEALPAGPEAATIAAELRLVDEYCHYRFRDAVAYLLLMAEGEEVAEVADAVGGAVGEPVVEVTDAESPLAAAAPDEGKTDAPADEPPPLSAAAFRARVVDLLAAEEAHAARSGYFLVRPDTPEDEKERYVHRRGELKRRIWAVLFLELRTSPLFNVRRQFGYMIAAGFAAIWYAFAQILVFLQVQPQHPRDFWGSSGFLFLLAATLAYIVKDRIKEIGRTYFGGGIFRKIPDHSEEIRYAYRGGAEYTAGQLQETATYVDAGQVPAGIVRLRETLAQAGSCDLESVEHVLHYTKDIRLSGKLEILGRYPLRVVHDILRLNIDAGLPRLGEPTRAMNVVTPDARVEAVEFPKVYYLDLALSYSRQDRAGHSSVQALDYFRLVVDKNGLLRIERLT